MTPDNYERRLLSVRAGKGGEERRGGEAESAGRPLSSCLPSGRAHRTQNFLIIHLPALNVITTLDLVIRARVIQDLSYVIARCELLARARKGVRALCARRTKVYSPARRSFSPPTPPPPPALLLSLKWRARAKPPPCPQSSPPPLFTRLFTSSLVRLVIVNDGKMINSLMVCFPEVIV